MYPDKAKDKLKGYKFMSKLFIIFFMLLVAITALTPNLLTLQDWGIRLAMVLFIQQAIISFKLTVLE